MGLLDIFKKPSKAKNTNVDNMHYVTLQLNAKLQPLDRGDIYEDPIIEALEACGCGVVDGGGTGLQESGEVDFCDVAISLNSNSKENLECLLRIIDELAVPKGSFIKDENLEIPVGTLEGLALYVNGTDLPNEVYESCDINYVADKINELLGQSGKLYSHWQGPQDTALYFYGTSFAEMNEKMAGFLQEYPLCQKCRVEQIA